MWIAPTRSTRVAPSALTYEVMAISSEVGRSLASFVSRVNCVLSVLAFAAFADTSGSAGFGGSAARPCAVVKPTTSATRLNRANRFDCSDFDIGAILACKGEPEVPRRRRQESQKYMPPLEGGQL